MTAHTAGVDHELALGLGLAVFPLPPGEKKAQAGRQHTLTRDPAQVRTWPADANVGVGCRASGIVGLDLDRHTTGANAGHDGVAGFAALCERWRMPRPVTLEVETPSGGHHLYLRVPAAYLDGTRLIPSVSGGRSRLGSGIDVRTPGRALGGYLVGPGSISPAGTYRVLADAPIARCPGWLLALLERRPQPTTGAASKGGRSSRWKCG